MADPNELHVTGAVVSPYAAASSYIDFHAGNDGRDYILRIAYDPVRRAGTVIRGPGFATDDAASMAFFDVMARCFPGWLGDLRLRAEAAEAEVATLRKQLAEINS